MTQGNGSPYKAFAYLLTVTVSLILIHISEVITAHYHQEEIRTIESTKSKAFQKKSKRKKESPNKGLEKKNADTLTSKSNVKDTIAATIIPSDSEFFTDLIESYDARRVSENESESRADVVIRYYKKNKDKDRVYKLRDLGFYIHERPAESDFDVYESNAIFYGDSVKREDLMLIAYKLIDNGLTLQSITLSKFHDAWKAHSVEIGTDTTALMDPPYNLAMLRKKWEDM